MAQEPRVYTQPFQVLCEGDGDDGFIRALAAEHSLPPFEVTTVAESGGFQAKLAAFEVLIDIGLIRRVLVLADNDDDPAKSFKLRKREIKRCGFYPTPKRPLHIRTSDRACVAVAMLPYTGQAGNLESLLLRSARKARPQLVQCAEQFAACSLNGGTDPWTQGQRDKMLLRSVLSAAIKDDPNSSLAYVWDKPGLPLDAKDAEFKWLADFILDFFK